MIVDDDAIRCYYVVVRNCGVLIFLLQFYAAVFISTQHLAVTIFITMQLRWAHFDLACVNTPLMQIICLVQLIFELYTIRKLTLSVSFLVLISNRCPAILTAGRLLSSVVYGARTWVI